MLNRRLLLLCAVCITSWAQTQSNTGQIEGIVSDSTGAAVPGAEVRLRNVETNLTRSLTTDNSGFYQAALLPIGVWDVAVTATGFAPYRQTGVQLSTGQVLSVNIKLELASTSTEVTVAANAALIETSQVSTSRSVNEVDIENLPNLSRSELNFAFLQPFTNGNRPREYEAPRLDMGGLARRLNYQVDGFQNSTTQQKSFRVIIFSTAALQETQILTFGANAEYGRTGGGVVNNIIKSGTNEFHGQASWVTSRKAWNARPFGAREGIKPHGNVWVGTVGGPIQKDRLFFFLGYEASKRAFPQSLGFTSETQRANAARLGFTGEELDVLPSDFNPQLWLLKLDWRPSERRSFSLRGNTFRELFNARDPGGLTVLSSSNGAIFNEFAIAGSYIEVFSPRLVNEFRGQIADRFTRRRPVVSPTAQTLPTTTVSGVATFGYPTGLTANREKIVEFSDNLLFQANRHQWKGGFNVVVSPLTFEDQMNATFLFGGLTASGSRPAVSAIDQYLLTRQGAIDPATGRPYTYTQLTVNYGERVLNYHQVYYGAYFQDQWRAVRDLTLNYGVRWETVTPPEGDPLAPYPLSALPFRRDANNFAPRFGFAWAPKGSTTTVIRGSYGIHFDAPQGNYYRDALSNNARRQVTVQISGSSAGAPVYPYFPASPAGLTAVRPSLTVISPDLAWMYAQQVQVGVQRALTKDLSLSVTYAFLRGTKIPVAQNINLLPVATGLLADGRPVYGTARVDPAFNNISMIHSAGNSNYNGLGTNLNKRLSKGVQFNLSYTWGHALDNAPETGISGGSEQPQDTFNRRAEYGNSLTDVRHTLNGSAVFRPRFKNRILDNNQLAFFFFARSGTTYDVRSGTDLNRDSVNNDRPLFFGRNTGKGPASTQWDVRYSRTFRFKERSKRLEFTAEAANVFNTTVPESTNGFINRTYGTGATPLATFGNILAWHEMRRLQMGVKFFY